MNNNAGDNGIPLLTEILELVPTEDQPPSFLTDLAVPTLQFDRRKAPSNPLFVAPPADPVLSAHAREKLVSELGERITRQVLSRIDFVLEQRVRDSLSDVLQIAVEGLALQIKHGLHQTVEEVITRAVAQELSRLPAEKN